jgi:hypothetical protein
MVWNFSGGIRPCTNIGGRQSMVGMSGTKRELEIIKETLHPRWVY